MTRDEVLERLDEFAAYYEGEIRECKSDWLKISYHQRSLALRAAAELIRAGGWRQIEDAPEGRPAVCGKHLPRGGDWLVYRFFSAAHAAKEGYTHYLPEPEPPAREVENG